MTSHDRPTPLPLHERRTRTDALSAPGRHKCLLFTTGEFREQDGQFVPDWASGAYCYYVILMAATLILIFIMQAVRTVVFIRHDTDA